jgi:hypothetical protein
VKREKEEVKGEMLLIPGLSFGENAFGNIFMCFTNHSLIERSHEKSKFGNAGIYSGWVFIRASGIDTGGDCIS